MVELGQPGASAAHGQIDHPPVKPVEGDVAAILSNCRTHARIQQFLDLRHYRPIRTLMLGVIAAGMAFFHQRPPRREVIHDGTENGRLDMGPVHVALGHGDEVRTEEDAGHALNRKDLARQGRCAGRFQIPEVDGARAHDRAARE